MIGIGTPRPSWARRAVRALLLMLVAAGLAEPALAQTVTGTIQGIVTDTTAAAVPGVTVSIRNVDTGTVREVVTNESGFYNAPFLPIGRYRLTAALEGFGAVTREGVSVRLNETLAVDFRLDPAVKESVTVVAERPPINLVTSDVKQSITAEQILDRPTVQNLNNNNTFLVLAETFAGFQENPTSGQNNPTASSGSSINFNGTGTRGATFQIDGVNNDDSSENQNRQGVNLAAIQEFQVISNTYSAEFGRGFGAVVLVQTKSGTNDVRGELFYYRQDSTFNALSYGQAVKPDNQRPSYGGVVGFPILKNRLFGFASFEHGRRDGQQTYLRDVFIPSDFAGPRLSRGNDTPANRAWQDAVLARYGNLVPNDPRSNRTYQGIVTFDQPVTDASLRLDWEPRTNDRLTLRYQYSRQKFDNEDIIVGEATQQNNRQANLGLTWTHIYSAQTVGEFRYGLGVRDTNVNIKAGNDTPIIRFAGSPVSGTIIGNAGTFPINRDQLDHQLVYNVSTLLGSRHNLKAGTDVRFSALDDVAQSFNRGFWSFTAACGGVTYPSSWAAFWDGCVASYTKAWGPDFLENRINEYNLYLEDSWKVTPNLTLNLGVRYEYAGAASEKEERIVYGYDDDANNVEPRIGFAWAPQWDSGFLKTLSGGPGNFSIRGGYGLFHGRIFQSVFSQTGNSLRTNPPYALSRAFNTTPSILNLSDPSGGFVFVAGPQTARHVETWPAEDLEMPYSHQWNLSLERALPWRSTLRLTYSSAMGRGLLRLVPDNLAALPATVVDHPNNPADLRGQPIDRVADDWRCAGTGFVPGQNPNAACPDRVPIAPNEVSLRVPRTNERRPDPRFAQNAIVDNDAESWYHGLQVQWTKAFSHGLWFDATYTWSKAIDNTSDATFLGTGDTNSLGPDKDYARGLSRYHTPHRFTFNGTWKLPFLSGRTDWVGDVFGGWQVSAVVKVSHGTPFTVIDTGGVDLNWDGFTEARPVIVDPSILGRTVGDPTTSENDLPRSAFRRATPAPGDDDYHELVGRNTFYADGVKNVDLGFMKSFGMPMNDRLMLRLNVFNLFNRRQWNFPSNDFASATFGRITTQFNSPRTLQLEARYIF
jgi:outer membrane receptor protein involved in Fe transport